MFLTAPKAEVFLKSIKSEVEEIIASGQNSSAKKLSVVTKQKFASNRLPRYFRGNLAAKIVFVKFNCSEIQDTSRVRFSTYQDYFKACQKLPDRQSIIENGSLSELKQLQFVEPFIEGWENRQKLDRLYLYLIPHTPISTFSLSGFTPKILQPYLEKTLNIITQFPRKCIIFCGSAFEQILSPYTIEKQNLDLLKNLGSSSRNLKFSILNLADNNQKFKVGLAHSFASLSMSASDYSKSCKRLYDEARV